MSGPAQPEPGPLRVEAPSSGATGESTEEAVRAGRRATGGCHTGSRQLLRRLDAAGEAPPLSAGYGVGAPVFPPGRPPVQTAPLRHFRTLRVSFRHSSLQHPAHLGRRRKVRLFLSSPVLRPSNHCFEPQTLPCSSCRTVLQRTSGRSWRTLHVLRCSIQLSHTRSYAQ